jgi:GT2 family glycosyltransferase
VSIVILCHLHVDLLVNCIASLDRHLPDAPGSETIVLFNGTPTNERGRARGMLGGARILESDVNLGFAAGNNRAVRDARGELLVFLNDDTEIREGWLEALVTTAENRPDAGAVGSRIVYPDGRLQEAGSIVWSDGSTRGVGRGLAAEVRRYEYLREVDYVSACSLLVRRELFEQIGGFDERFYPAYNEDVDLCLGIKARGRRVLYQPRSVVVHHESQTGGDAKTFLILRGRKLVVEKWGPTLAELPDPTLDEGLVELAVHRARRSPRRLLIIDDRLPDPGAGSGFGRMLEAIRELSGVGYAISFHPTDNARGDRAELTDLGVEIVAGDLLEHLQRPANWFDVAIVSRPHNFGNVAVLRRYQPQCALIYDAESLFHRRLEREAELLAAQEHPNAAQTRADAALARELESEIVRAADRLVSVSAVEAAELRAIEGACPVDVIEPLAAGTEITPAPFERRRGIVFVAGWLAPYPSPNSDGLEWLVAEVLPHVAARLPWVRLSVSGSQPHQQLLPLASPSVRFVGHVENLAELYNGARVAVVPARYGAGIKIKAVEALQHGVPVVATGIGAEGVDGADGPGVSIADDPRVFAEHLAHLLDDRERWSAARAATEAVYRRKRAVARPSWPVIVETALMEKNSGSVALHG